MICIDPLIPIPPVAPIYYGDPMSNFLFYPALFDTEEESNDFLSSLDSDTRDYVMKHTDEFRSKSDMIDCVNNLRNKSQE